MHCVPPRCSTESCTRSAGAPPRCQWLVSCSVYIAAARPMDSSSARVGIQFKSLPRRRKVISKFTCVVVPTTGTSSTSTTCPRSVSVRIRGRLPRNVVRRGRLASAVLLRRGFGLATWRPVFTTLFMNYLRCGCQRSLEDRPRDSSLARANGQSGVRPPFRTLQPAPVHAGRSPGGASRFAHQWPLWPRPFLWRPGPAASTPSLRTRA